MQCAGAHRGLGVHISFIRSLSMDTWSNKQLQLMSVGGNQELELFFEPYHVADLEIQKKYRTKAAYFYREMLKAASEGRVLETEKPNPEEGAIIIEEERKAMPVKEKAEIKSSGIKDTVEAAFKKTRGFGKNIKDKVNGMSMKGVENKAKNALSKIEDKVESWNVKANLKKVRDKTEGYYNALAESAKSALSKYKTHKFILDDKLEEGEDELLLDPQGKAKRQLKQASKHKK